MNNKAQFKKKDFSIHFINMNHVSPKNENFCLCYMKIQCFAISFLSDMKQIVDSKRKKNCDFILYIYLISN